MMKLALLGCSEETLLILPSLVDRGFEVTHAALAGPFRKHIEAIAGRPIETVDDPAEWLEGPGEADAVVVSTGVSEQTEPLLRRWAAEAFPTLAVVPVCDSLTAHELAMQAPSHPVPHVIWFPEDRPAWQKIVAGWIRSPEDSPIGRVQRLVWNVSLPADRTEIARALARHALWSRRCGVTFEAAGAFAPMHGEHPSLDRMEVTITTDTDLVVAWHNRPQTSRLVSLRIEGERDSMELVYDPRCGSWEPRRLPEEVSWPADDRASAIASSIDPLVAEVRSDGADGASDESWPALCQALEVADRFEYSIRRRRMVDLVQQTPSEETAFKGVMAAGSCLLLMLFLAIFVVGSIWESAVRERPRSDAQHAVPPTASDRSGSGVPAIRWRRIWPAIPLLLYLLLQLLIVIARSSDRDRNRAASGLPPERENANITE